MSLALSADRFAALFHSARSERKRVLVLGAYIDGSNLHDGADIVVVAAYVAETAVWADWERRWADLIAFINRETPCRITRWHHVDFVQKANEFRDIREPEWLMAKKMLWEAFEAAKPFGFAEAVYRADYEAVRAGAGGHLPEDPYYFLLDRIMAHVIHGIFSHPKDDGILVYCDQDKAKALVMALASWHEAYLRAKPAEWDFHDERLRPVMVAYGSSVDYVPIQAADVLAYEVMRSARARGPDWAGIGAYIPPHEQIAARLFKAGPLTAMLHIRPALEMEADGRAFVPDNLPGYHYLPPDLLER